MSTIPLPSAIIPPCTRAAQPSALLVPVGALSSISDENNILEQSNGSAWVPYTQQGILLRSIVTLTNDQIKLWPTTPVQAIGAAPSGYFNRLVYATYHANITAHYTNLNASYVELAFKGGSEYVCYGPVDDATTTPPITLITQLLGTNGNWVYSVPFSNASYWGPVPTPPSLGYVLNNVVNSAAAFAGALMLTMGNNGVDLIGGDPANTVRVASYYTLEPLS